MLILMHMCGIGIEYEADSVTRYGTFCLLERHIVLQIHMDYGIARLSTFGEGRLLLVAWSIHES